MELKDYITTDESGNQTLDEAKFLADLDKIRNEASETARKNYDTKTRSTVEKELRAKLEEEAKLSADEKLKQEMEAFKNEKISWNKSRMKDLYLANNYTDEEAEVLSGLVGEDYESASEAAKKLIETRKTADEARKAKILEDIQSKQGNPTTNTNGSGGESEMVKRAKAQNEIMASNKRVEL